MLLHRVWAPTTSSTRKTKDASAAQTKLARTEDLWVKTSLVQHSSRRLRTRTKSVIKLPWTKPQASCRQRVWTCPTTLTPKLSVQPNSSSCSTIRTSRRSKETSTRVPRLNLPRIRRANLAAVTSPTYKIINSNISPRVRNASKPLRPFIKIWKIIGFPRAALSTVQRETLMAARSLAKQATRASSTRANRLSILWLWTMPQARAIPTSELLRLPPTECPCREALRIQPFWRRNLKRLAWALKTRTRRVTDI